MKASTRHSVGKLRSAICQWVVRWCVSALLALSVAGVTGAAAQTPVDIYNFGSISGDADQPFSPSVLVQGRDGNLYGTAQGGANGHGAVFRITPTGVETLIYNFLPTDGNDCYPGLTLGSDGNFYGVCYTGGANNSGAVYKTTPSGTFTLLHSFTGTGGEGAQPDAPPVQGKDGNYYGTTQVGGGSGFGTIYKVTPSGTFTTIHSFSGPDGQQPIPGLVLGNSGSLYGAAIAGGSIGCGTIFQVNSAGTLTVLHNFTCTDGAFPLGVLIQGKDGNFYGTTEEGGTNGIGVVYKMTPSGSLTVLHNFVQTTDGELPQVGLVQGTDGNLYGVSFGAGPNNLGTIFKVTTKGVFSVVYSFDGSVAENPASALLQHTNGLLYGDTTNGGTSHAGIVYSFNRGAVPFCSLQTASGKIGAMIGVFGQGFTSSSVAEFGGVSAAKVTLTGSTFLTATVPGGALTGSVTVTTGSTTLTCKQTFKVTPMLKSFSPPAGPVGTTVTITGAGLTQASKVTFNGTSAAFTVNSDAQVTATVPTGATTGKIGVTTKGGTATSTTTFTIP